MRLLITGGCGFIGSNFVRFVLEHYQPEFVTNVDVLSYAGNPANLAGIPEKYADRYEFFQSDIADRDAVETILAQHKFYAIVNFAAESHVDRSISDPGNFIHTNVIGTEVLLEGARKHGVKRFVQVSTDEVYGSLGPSRKVHGVLTIGSEFAVFGEQGVGGFAGAGVVQDVRAGGAHHALLE